MHELSVTQALLRQVETVAAQHDSHRVVAITLAIGPLSGVEAPLLVRAFTVARAGTIAEEAMLEIETMPVTVWCGACDAETEVAPNALLCGSCGTWRVDLRSGNELLLKRVELAAADAAIAAE